MVGFRVEVSSQLNVFAAALTKQLYLAKLRVSASSHELLWIGRAFCLVLGTVLIVTALLIPFLGGAVNVVIASSSLIVVPLMAPAIWGLFSPNISRATVWSVVVTSFAIGLALKLPLTGSEFVPDHPLIQSLFEWAADSEKQIDLIVGVIAPIAILLLWTRVRSEDPGWQRSRTRYSAAAAPLERTQTDVAPAGIVAVTLAAIGLAIFFVGVLSEQDALPLFLFGGVMSLISAVVWGIIRTRLRP